MPSGFDGLPLTRDYAVGSIRGVRAFDVTIEGLLRSVTQPTEWGVKEMRADCMAYVNEDKVPKRDDESYAEREVRVAEWKKTHNRADCMCGFYAYFAINGAGLEKFAHSHILGSTPQVSGIVDAYGWVQVGEKGFRAERVILKAITIPVFQGLWRLDPMIVDRLHENYPTVPFFTTHVAMLGEFPTNVYDDFADDAVLHDINEISTVSEEL